MVCVLVQVMERSTHTSFSSPVQITRTQTYTHTCVKVA